MEIENLDIDSIAEARQKAIKESIHAVGIEELKSLGEALFPLLDNPWRDAYFAFLAENADQTFHRAAANDGIEIIYCHARERGMWFIPGQGMGPLQAKGLKTLKEIVEEAEGR